MSSIIFPRTVLLLSIIIQWLEISVYTKNFRNMYSFKGIEAVHKGHNMVIFVLDKTIWPFQVESLNKSLATLSEIKHSDLGNLTINPETHTCLDFLQKHGYVIAAIFSCKVPNLAENLLDAFDLTRYFAYQVCSEEDKVSPLITLHTQSGVDFEDMLYFDYDLKENLPIFELNITFCPVDDKGISMETVKKALQIFEVRTTLIPPLSTTPKQKNPNDSSQYSLEIDYNQLQTFTHLKTEEVLGSSEEAEEEGDDY